MRGLAGDRWGTGSHRGPLRRRALESNKRISRRDSTTRARLALIDESAPGREVHSCAGRRALAEREILNCMRGVL